MNNTLRAFGISIAAALLSFNTASNALATPAEKLASLGTSESNDTRSSGLVAGVHAIERGEKNNFVSVTWSIENHGATDVYFGWPHGQSYTYSDATFYAGVTATSDNGTNRHHPIMDENTECLCSGNISTEFVAIIDPGEQVAYWSMYSVPEDVDTITLEIPGFEPIEDIPIS